MGLGLAATHSHVRHPFQCRQQASFLLMWVQSSRPNCRVAGVVTSSFALAACCYHLRWHCYTLGLMLLDGCIGAAALQTSVLTAELSRALQLDKLELAKGRHHDT